MCFLGEASAKNSEMADHVTVEAMVPITATTLERVYCFAPVWNSFEWVNQSRVINVKGIATVILLKMPASTFLCLGMAT